MSVQNYAVPGLPDEIREKINLYLEEIYPESEKAGTRLAGSGLNKTQVRGLENIIVSTTRFSEVINYIKNQTGKGKNTSPWRKVDGILLEQLAKIEKKAGELAGDDPGLKLQVKMKILKGWARQVVAHFLYKAK